MARRIEEVRKPGRAIEPRPARTHCSLRPRTSPRRRGRDSDAMTGLLTRAYTDALHVGDPDAAAAVVADALRNGLSAVEIQSQVIAPAMWRIGELWEQGTLSVAQEHLATSTTQHVLARLYPSQPRHSRVRARSSPWPRSTASSMPLACGWSQTSSRTPASTPVSWASTFRRIRFSRGSRPPASGGGAWGDDASGRRTAHTTAARPARVRPRSAACDRRPGGTRRAQRERGRGLRSRYREACTVRRRRAWAGARQGASSRACAWECHGRRSSRRCVGDGGP